MTRLRVLTSDGLAGINLDTLPYNLLRYNWSDTNLPWAFKSTTDFESRIPAGLPVVDLQTGASTFYENLESTVNAQSGRFLVRLPAGVFTLNEFKPIGSSGNPTYAFGFWFPKLAGFVGAGADNTIIEMAPNSMTSDQLNYMATMTQSSFVPLNMGLCRIDTQYNGSAAPIYLGGLTFEAGPQNALTSISADITNSVYVPQSAPHQGVIIYSDSSRRHPDSIITHVRFRGAGKAMMSQPPFECANIGSQRNHITYRNCEFDGRMSPRYDTSRPRKCGPIMTNGGVYQDMIDCWMHHSNVSRYAANDESVLSSTALSNTYRFERCKIEQITNNQNRQPPINSGNSLGGYTNATLFGFESSNAKVEFIDCIGSVDNPYNNGQIPCHVQFTNTGPARQGGRMTIVGGEWRHTVYPQLDGFITFRIQPTTHWWTDGFNTTLDVRKTAGGSKLTPHQYTGTWPPSQAYLNSNGLTPDTHYIVRSTS